jgi:hypothetical protein
MSAKSSWFLLTKVGICYLVGELIKLITYCLFPRIESIVMGQGYFIGRVMIKLVLVKEDGPIGRELSYCHVRLDCGL